MENQNDINSLALDFDFQPAEENHSIIKVVGVGGGGSNAVQHMYEAGIQDVSFLVINTDKQALKGSSIPNKLLISEKGLGAGAKPEVAREFANQYKEAIQNALKDGTEMVFITAGMGGGTGTGAAPVVAEIAHDMGILTVGIVTIPFRFEGRKKIIMALDGVRDIEKWCDALLVVNNDRLIDVYPDLNFGNAFGKADDTLTTAAKSISDIINIQGYINLDFADVSTTLRNGGVALISTGFAEGENRLSKAIESATCSPLLQDNKINDAKHLLFELCFSHENPISMSEIAEMNKFVETLNTDIEVIWGAMYDDSLGNQVKIILLASGFSMDHSTGIVYADSVVKEREERMRLQLRQAIADRQSYIGEFDGCPEAQEILSTALHEAGNRASILSVNDSLDDEIAILDTAIARAQQVKQEKDNAARAAALAREEELRQESLRRQIEALERELSNPPVVPVVESLTSVPEVPVNPEVPQIPNTVPEGQQTPPTPRPAKDALSGIEEIRHYYGEEKANKMILDETRKAYYVLDDQDLTNEQLIERLEHLPAYNRNLEDFGQLRAVSHQPAQPKVIGCHDNLDGTIKF